MGVFVRAAADAVKRFNAALRFFAAWQGWPLTIITLSTFGITFHLSDFTVYILTVQTAIAASVADIAQRYIQTEDEKRDKKTDAMLSEIRKNGKMVLAAITATNDLLEYIITRDIDGPRRESTAAKGGSSANRTK